MRTGNDGSINIEKVANALCACAVVRDSAAVPPCRENRSQHMDTLDNTYLQSLYTQVSCDSLRLTRCILDLRNSCHLVKQRFKLL